MEEKNADKPERTRAGRARLALTTAANWIGARSATPQGSTVITLLIILAGGFASIMQPEIRACAPFHLDVTWQGVVFWIVATLASVLFFCREAWRVRALQERDAEANRKWNEQFDRQEKGVQLVADIIRTMPPEGFLNDYATLFLSLSETTDECLDDPHVKGSALAAQMRSLLQAIAVLAKRFDRGHASERYAANAMVFIDSRFLRESTAQGIRNQVESLLLDEGEVAIEKLRGVLLLRRALSSSTDGVGEGSAVDDQIDDLALAIRNEYKHGTRYVVLPGAPIAFAERAYAVLPDTEKFREWADQNGDYRKEVIDKVEEHFRKHPGIRSIQSHAVFPPGFSSGENGAAPIAVVNVHSSRPGMLSGGREEMFPAIVRPLLRLVSLLIVHSALGEVIPGLPSSLKVLPNDAAAEGRDRAQHATPPSSSGSPPSAASSASAEEAQAEPRDDASR